MTDLADESTRGESEVHVIKRGDFKIATWRFYVVCMLLVSEAISSSMLFSYVGLFIAHIEPSFTRSSAGYIAGFLVGAFQATQVISLPLWGRLSDRIGRRPVLFAASALSVVSSILFGCAPSFAFALLARGLHGLVAGGVSAAKTIIYEVTDEHSQARGFGLMNLMWAVGTFVGPSIGGFFYDLNNSPLLAFFFPADVEAGVATSSGGSEVGGSPVSQSRVRFEIFDQHPALPPALAMAAYAALAGILAFCFVPETNQRRVPFSVVVADVKAWMRTTGRQVNSTVGGATSNNVNTNLGDEEECAEDEPMLPIGPAMRELGSDGSSVQEGQTSFVEASIDRKTSTRQAGVLVDMEKESGLDHELQPDRSNDEGDIFPQAAAKDGNEEPPPTEVERAEEEIEEEQDRQDGNDELNEEERKLSDFTDKFNEALNAKDSISTKEILSHPLLQCSVPMYMLLCGYNIAYNEVFPLYAVAYRQDGGLGFSSTLVGVAGMINAVISVAANSVFGRVSDKVPMMTLWCNCHAVAGAAIFSLGFLTFLPSTTACLVAFVPFCLLRTTAVTFAFSINMMITANAAPKRHLGAVTTTTMAGASIARSFAPMIAAPIFAWSISSGGRGDKGDGSVSDSYESSGEEKTNFSFWHFTLFAICSAMAFACVFLGRRLPQRVIQVRRK